MKSLFQQIQELSYTPSYRAFSHPDKRDGSDARAAKWKLLSDEIYNLNIAIVQLQLTDGNPHTLEMLEREVAATVQERELLKAEYWTKGGRS